MESLLQAAWARTCEVGCAIAFCPKLPLDNFGAYLYSIHIYGSGIPYLVVCSYGPGNPDTSQPPYIKGDSCDQCPDQYPLCTNSSESGMGSGFNSGSRGRTRRQAVNDDVQGQTGDSTSSGDESITSSGDESSSSSRRRNEGLCCKLKHFLLVDC